MKSRHRKLSRLSSWERVQMKMMSVPDVALSKMTSREPRHDSSSIEPSEASVGPDIVPVPRRSPGRMLQPVTLNKENYRRQTGLTHVIRTYLWCTSCCLMFQYRYFMLELLTRDENSSP